LAMDRDACRGLLQGCFVNLNRLRDDFRRDISAEERGVRMQIEHFAEQIERPRRLDGWIGELGGLSITEQKWQSDVVPVIALPEAVAQWLEYRIDQLDYALGVVPGSLEAVRDAYRLVRDLEVRGYPKTFKWLDDLADDEHWDSQRAQVEL